VFVFSLNPSKNLPASGCKTKKNHNPGLAVIFGRGNNGVLHVRLGYDTNSSTFKPLLLSFTGNV
jgi:hypothetical protein